MKAIKMFKLRDCPYCQRALRDMEILKREHPEYQKIPLEIIDEAEQRALADQYDYYYVPTFYVGKTKAAEGVLTKEDIQSVFESALCQ